MGSVKIETEHAISCSQREPRITGKRLQINLFCSLDHRACWQQSATHWYHQLVDIMREVQQLPQNTVKSNIRREDFLRPYPPRLAELDVLNCTHKESIVKTMLHKLKWLNSGHAKWFLVAPKRQLTLVNACMNGKKPDGSINENAKLRLHFREGINVHSIT